MKEGAQKPKRNPPRRSRPGGESTSAAKGDSERPSRRKPSRARVLIGHPGLRKWIGWIATALFVAFCALLGVAFYLSHKAGPKTGPVTIDIPEDASLGDIANLLADNDLVSDRFLTATYFRMTMKPSDVVRGPHLLIGGRSASELEDLLMRSALRPKVKVTVPEGFHRFAIGSRLEELGVTSKADFLRATSDPGLLNELGIPGPNKETPESAEGYLFPATYQVGLDSPAEEIIRTMVEKANEEWGKAVEAHPEGLTRLGSTMGFGRREAIILASMIEKEAAKADERPIIASVFINRLTDPSFTPHKLQSDPSSGYGCMVHPELAPCAGYQNKITPKMNNDRENKYSTYVTEGLPPGPISNPGAGSIAAMLAPAETHYFYFVAKGGGRHTFSETLEEHKKAIHGGQ